MKMSAEAKLAKIAKNASATMNFINPIISAPRQRALLVATIATVLGVVLTVRLGVWQLSRAQEKEALHAAILALQALPEIDTATALRNKQALSRVHQRVSLEGRWLPQFTVYLENRPMDGRAGFIVLTPLQLDASTTVLVQRGWIPRHPQDRTWLAAVDTPEGIVHVAGRIAAAPSEVMQLGNEAQGSEHPNTITSFEKGDPLTPSASAPSAEPRPARSPIRQNIHTAAFSQEIGTSLVATVLQTQADADGLKRHWPEITAGVEKHWGYAFQWFALAALQLLLFFWYQWIKPYRHARQTPP